MTASRLPSKLLVSALSSQRMSPNKSESNTPKPKIALFEKVS